MWGDGAKGREHHAGVPKLKSHKEQSKRRLPAVLGKPQHNEDHHLDECAASDDRETSISLGTDSPERNQRQAEDEERRVEVSGPRRHLWWRHVHGPEVERQEAEHMGNGECLDRRGDPEEYEQSDPPGCPSAQRRGQVQLFKLDYKKSTPRPAPPDCHGGRSSILRCKPPRPRPPDTPPRAPTS